MSGIEGLYISSWLTIVLVRKEGKRLVSCNINLLFDLSITYESEVAINLEDIMGDSDV